MYEGVTIIKSLTRLGREQDAFAEPVRAISGRFRLTEHWHCPDFRGCSCNLQKIPSIADWVTWHKNPFIRLITEKGRDELKSKLGFA